MTFIAIDKHPALSTQYSVLSTSLCAGAADELARLGVCVRAAMEDACAIHPDVADADGELVRLGEGGTVTHGFGIEDHDVRVVAGAEHATVAQTEPIRDSGGH